MVHEEAAFAEPVPPLSRRREKTPKKRTGKVRPASASRAGNQAREPRRRQRAPTRTRYARN